MTANTSQTPSRERVSFTRRSPGSGREQAQLEQGGVTRSHGTTNKEYS